MKTIANVTNNPIIAHHTIAYPQNVIPSFPWKATPNGNILDVAAAMNKIAETVVAIKLLYRAFMTFPSLPSFTNNVPNNEATMHIPEINNGYRDN